VSHFSVLKTRLIDRECLLLALHDMGFNEVEEHTSPQALYGYQGDIRTERAQIIVRRKYIGLVSNDIGFHELPEGGFVAIISDFDRHKYGSAWLQKLTQRHAYHLVQKQLGQQGFSLIGEELGTEEQIHLRLRRAV
jgi:hypothetical protein